jgi:hypothetical protein
MSAVSEQGTIRNIIRGIDDVPFHLALFEIIDDAEHSKSKKVFIDMNFREKSIIVGFENPATSTNLDNIVRWSATQSIHQTNNLSTCGTGAKFYQYLLRGDHSHHSYFDEDEATKYIQSGTNSSRIYDSAREPSISEIEFSHILNRNTFFVKTEDETTPSISNIYTNKDSKYPFSPKTIFMTRNITNEHILYLFMLDQTKLKDDDEITRVKNNIDSLTKNINIKYFEEIKNGTLELFIKYPTSSEFTKIDAIDKYDVIGTTIKSFEFVTLMYEVMKDILISDTRTLKKGEYIMKIHDKFFYNKKNGNSKLRDELKINDETLKDLKYIFKYTQFQIPPQYEKLIEKNMDGKSGEKYCGNYLKIGNKFINSCPIPTTITKRNLPGNKFNRGVLEVNDENAVYIKFKLQLHGLKAKFNLTDMPELEHFIKQCNIIYKNYISCDSDDKETNPESYVIVKGSNEKTKKDEKSEKSGIIYILHVGDSFYKFGMAGKSNKSKRIFNYYTDDDLLKAKKDFPEETIFDKKDITFRYLSSYEFKNASTIEQMIKEFILDCDDVDTYDKKIGDDIREYFHCDNESILSDIVTMIKENSKY